jgi:AraC family transcriptional regulator
LHEAHAAIEAWLGAHALKPAGDPWEVYVTDPGEVPNPAEWQTLVVWPTNE